jgi:N6-adenosine-specific RNA methylase IME4
MLIDPPWPKFKGGTRRVRPNQGRGLDYRTMTVDAIFNLLDRDVFSLAAQQHSLFIWTIESFLTPCEELMSARGYRRHCRMIWDKGNGIAPCFSIRFGHEYLIWYYRGKFVPVAAAVRGKFLSVFREAPREHSRKPDCAYRLIEQLYPGSRRFDVFSRQGRQGWDQSGDQSDFFNP